MGDFPILLLYVGDCKTASGVPHVSIMNKGDFYLCSLPAL
jgi:hypothetical protein